MPRRIIMPPGHFYLAVPSGANGVPKYEGAKKRRDAIARHAGLARMSKGGDAPSHPLERVEPNIARWPKSRMGTPVINGASNRIIVERQAQ